jgi:hypothetical protein
MKTSGRYRLSGVLLFLTILFFGQKLWAQGEINVRLTNGTGPSIFTGCRNYLGVFDVNAVPTVTLHIENQSTTENLTLTSFQNIFNSGEMNVSISGNTCGGLPVTLNPGQHCQITLTLDPNISAVMEDTLNINNSDVDEGLYQIFISLTTLDPVMNDRLLILNEVSQGDGGVREFVEFLVVGRPGTCRDVRGWLFDDNSGRPGGPGSCGSGPSGAGIATGHARLSQNTQWQNIPCGSLIVIYNHLDRNIRMPADDTNDSNNDNVYIIPISNSTLLDKYPTCPSATGAGCNNFSCAVGVNNIWDFLGMANDADMFQLIDPNNLTNFHHSVSWGTLTGTGSTVYFSGSAYQKTIQFVNTVSDNAFLQANWRYENVTNPLPNGDTPGLPNSTKNQRWLESVRFKTYGCVNNRAMTPNPNDSCVVFLSTNATENVIAYEWDFNNDNTIDRTTTTPYTNFSYNSNGAYTIRVRLNTGTACSQFQTVTVNCYTFAKFSEIFYVRYDASRKGAILNWATDNPNAETHVVERSLDGKNFQPIHEVKTTPKTNVLQLQYTDLDLPIIAERVYYRVSYRETSGATQTLPIRELRLNRPDLLTLAPNPATAELNVSAPEAIQSCTVIDATGRSIFSLQAPDNKGVITLPTESLPEGVYWLLVHTARDSYYKRWVKM